MRLIASLSTLCIMLIIFLVSTEPNYSPPIADAGKSILNNSGHVVGHALLAGAAYLAAGAKRGRRLQVWLFVLTYATIVELYQFRVPGRTSTIWDVLIFDNLGAVLGIWLVSKLFGSGERTRASSRQR